MSSDGYPFIGEKICIRALSYDSYQAFVSKYNGGSDEWYDLVHNFGPDAQWSRTGWEVAAIRNKDDTARRGFYVTTKNQTVYITVRSIEDIEVVIAPKAH